MSSERILCAAIHFDDGKEHERQPLNIKRGFVLCGLRHGNCFGSVQNYEALKLRGIEETQGFLTSSGRFVDRKEAWLIAIEQNQIASEPTRHGILFSEDLY